MQTRRGLATRNDASPLAANDHLYIADREGAVLVVEDDMKFAVVGTNKFRTQSIPHAFDNQLFLRGAEYLYGIRER